jgi:hypothetical protein
VACKISSFSQNREIQTSSNAEIMGRDNGRSSDSDEQ